MDEIIDLYNIQLEEDKMPGITSTKLKEAIEVKSDKFDISSLISSIKLTNLIYSDTLIKRFTYSLLTKPFVILSGLAGSGKTQLAMAFAKAMVEDEESQLCFVSVGADCWIKGQVHDLFQHKLV